MPAPPRFSPKPLPPQAAARLEQALAHHKAGRLAEAQALYQSALALAPDDPQTLHLSGVVALQRGDSAAAAAAIARAIALRPDAPEPHLNLGLALARLGRFEEAERSFSSAIALKRDFISAVANRAIANMRLGRFGRALEDFDVALAARPTAELHHGRASALRELGRPQEAVAGFQETLRLAPDNPEAHNNLGGALTDIGQPDAAIAAFTHAIELRPGYALAWSGRGNAFLEQHHIPEALADLDKALSLDPGLPDAAWNKALALLTSGDLVNGFRFYEWRWKAGKTGLAPPQHTQPRWNCEPLAGKTILLTAEQGLGDAIQFSRYAAPLAQQGARVIVETHPALLDLLKRIDGVAGVVAIGDAPGQFDVHYPLLSLPHALETSLESIPAPASYVAADPAKAAHWRQRLGDGHPRIGLVWSGNRAHRNDASRSIALSSLLPHLPSGSCYVGLQKDIRDTDRAALGSRPDILDVARDLHDFTDTAALCAALDLVVSVDTSVAHLAGALGKPVWLLLPFNADWRWLMDRADSPWYPGMKLYRQPARGDWQSVFARLESDLAAFRTRD